MTGNYQDQAERLFDQLVAAAPGFQEVVREHIEDNDEIIPYVLLADISRAFVRLLRSSRADSAGSDAVPAWVTRVLAIFEDALTESQDMHDLVGLSFVEAVHTEAVTLDHIPALLPPGLKAEWITTESYYGGA